jgi:amino acid permease
MSRSNLDKKDQNNSYDTFANNETTGDMSTEEVYAAQCGLEAPEKNIDMSGSWALTVNNVIGPAMMSIPHLFQAAGWLPTTVCIVMCTIGSSLCATFLADAISSIPGNENFDQNIEFGTAFRKIIGDDAYLLSEILFLISCMVQACAGLVEAAQGLDGFIASFVLGKTYAIQLSPSVELIGWSVDDCSDTEDASDCTPFHNSGNQIITIGYIMCCICFFPLSRGYLKEIIWVQMLVVVFSLVLLLQFESEFFQRGLQSSVVPMIGKEMGPLAGVILFNFAFTITVPTWLKEKKSDVDVNCTIWSSTLVSMIVYIAFGWTAAMAFPNVDTEIIKDLASPQTHELTRFAAAIFGMLIIGCGVPVFCVMIKSSLYSSRMVGASWAFFWGASFPYLASWTMYQGTALMDILNWTGLIVNGAVAFLLPLALVLYTFQARDRKISSDLQKVNNRNNHQMSENSQLLSSYNNDNNNSKSMELEENRDEVHNNMFVMEYEDFALEGTVHPLPGVLVPYKQYVVMFLLSVFSIVILGTIGYDIYNGEVDTSRRSR